MVDWQADERLADWVDGNLRGKELERFEAEMSVNPELRREAEEYRAWTARIGKALREDTRSPDGITDRIMAATHRTRAGGARFLPWLGSLAAAAALVIVFLAIWRTDDAAEPRLEPVVREVPESALESDEKQANSTGSRLRSADKDVLGRLEDDGDAARRTTTSAGKVLEARQDSEERDAPTPAEDVARAFRLPEAESPLPSEEPEESDLAGAAAPVEEVRDEPAAGTDEDADDFFFAGRVAVDEVERVEFGADTPILVVTLPVAELGEDDPDASRDAAGALEGADSAASRLERTSLGLVEAPIKTEPWADSSRPRLRRLSLGKSRADDDVERDVMRSEGAGPAKKSAPPAPETAARLAGRARFEPQAGDQVFELRGTRAQIGDYLRRLGELARQNRASVATGQLEPGTELLVHRELRSVQRDAEAGEVERRKRTREQVVDRAAEAEATIIVVVRSRR